MTSVYLQCGHWSVCSILSEVLSYHIGLELELELENVHKKNYYKTIDGKEAQSLYKSPVIAKTDMPTIMIWA